jgi:hypothetical protein
MKVWIRLALIPGVLTGFGIRAGPSVGKPCYWSVLSLGFVKTISKLKKISVKTLSRLLFTPYLVSLYFGVTLPRFDLKSLAIFSRLFQNLGAFLAGRFNHLT